MIKTALTSSAPFLAAATLQQSAGELHGINSSQLGTGLLIVMALAVILNQLWTLFDKARRAIRNPEADTSGLALSEVCDQRNNTIEASLAQLKSEDLRQDRITKEQFKTITDALHDLRGEFREDIKGLHKRSDDVLRAVSRLEGKVNK